MKMARLMPPMHQMARRSRLIGCAALVVGLLGACGASEDDPGTPAPGEDGGPDAGSDVTANPCAGGKPDAPPGAATLVETTRATALGLTAFSVNGRIQPRGRPTSYAFEYGKTTTYGAKTTEAPLPPKLAAHYQESWNERVAGWSGGLSGTVLKFVPTGGHDGKGFVRYTAPSDIDANHSDGIGANELVQYMYPGVYSGQDFQAWSAGDPDLRGAKISTYVRGTSFVSNNSELTFWIQSTDKEATKYDPACNEGSPKGCTETARWSNWAFTGFNLTDSLFTNKWEKVSYRLISDTTQWTYAGHYVAQNRADYLYIPLDYVLSHGNGDIFHMLVFVDVVPEPTGSLDFDDIEITYRNKSVLLTSNGGKLISSPTSADDPARLTDGWRNGPNRTWRSAASPQEPLELVYELERPVNITALQLHQNPDWPSKDIEVLVSEDGVSYQLLSKDVIPATASAGPNYAYYMNSAREVNGKKEDGIPVLPWLNLNAKRIKVRVLSGYKAEYWGLGEIEVFGTGAVMQTDDDWYNVTADITKVAAGETYHYRLVARNDAGTTFGPDLTFTVPATTKPDVLTCAATRVAKNGAKLEGRVNPLGVESQFYFEYGLDVNYGSRTGDRYSGLELTPRTVADTVIDLEPGKTYHYRVVAVNKTGTSFGADSTFVAK